MENFIDDTLNQLIEEAQEIKPINLSSINRKLLIDQI